MYARVHEHEATARLADFDSEAIRIVQFNQYSCRLPDSISLVTNLFTRVSFLLAPGRLFP